jgi:glutaminyl-peptide cyclotransferase
MKRILLPLVLLLLLTVSGPQPAAQTSARVSPKSAPDYTYTVIHVFPHDTSAFTQGLAYRDGFLYEGTGRNGQSSLRKVRLETGEVVQQAALDPEYFGEGITLVGDKILQLTWKSQTGFVYDLNTFHLLRRFSYPGEGWGLASNGHEVYLSDGSSEIRVLNSDSLQERRRIKVYDGPTQVEQLNELEFVEGQIFANVWHSSRIARISPQTGEVVGWIDLTGLPSAVYRLDAEAVLNGIAFDPIHKRLFITGKLWPSVFEIRLSLRPGR